MDHHQLSMLLAGCFGAITGLGLGYLIGWIKCNSHNDRR